GQNITNTLVSNLQGISPSIARELVCGTENSLIKIWQKLQKLICSFNAGQWEPTALLDKNKKITAFLPVKLSMSPYSNWKRIRFREMSLLLDRYFLEREETENKQQLLEQLRNKVNRILTRSQKKERQQQIEYQSALNADRYRLWGDILLANLSQIPKGAKEITLPNFYREGEKVTIPLDPSSSAAANAQRYFRKYRKSKNSHAKIMAQLNQTKNEINYLESVLYNLEHANLQELQEIQEELERCGYIKKQRGKEKKQLSSSSSPLRFLSSEGYEILVGKNNRQNELLTFKLASKHDIWLHVKDQPGSHVIIKGKNPPAKTLHEGALLAAFYSKAADSANVPVDYTEVRHLRKPPGGKPGMVIYKNHHTLFVTPKTEIIKKLQALSNNIINPPQ
ncbi:MAG: fibronectin-binding domain-containing protein, partial [Firmicutes bacterium]|nr:fibronectin-binding domain-containing protein [Bacillota bacterium]